MMAHDDLHNPQRENGTMTDNKIEKVCVHIDYEIDGERYHEEQTLAAERLSSDRFRLRSSSGFLSDNMLYYGDEIIVVPREGTEWQLVNVADPSAMAHFFCVASSPPKAITEILHRLGGEWECDMGGLTTFHIPVDRIEEFGNLTNLRFKENEALKSGLRNFDE